MKGGDGCALSYTAANTPPSTPPLSGAGRAAETLRIMVGAAKVPKGRRNTGRGIALGDTVRHSPPLASYAESKKTLKGYYPQERWQDYGIPDKR